MARGQIVEFGLDGEYREKINMLCKKYNCSIDEFVRFSVASGISKVKGIDVLDYAWEFFRRNLCWSESERMEIEQAVNELEAKFKDEMYACGLKDYYDLKVFTLLTMYPDEICVGGCYE